MPTMEQNLKMPLSQAFRRPPAVPMGRWIASLYFSVLGGLALAGIGLMAVMKLTGTGKTDFTWFYLLFSLIVVAVVIATAALLRSRPVLGVGLGLLVSGWDVVRVLTHHAGGFTLSAIGFVLCLWAATTLRKPG